MNKIYISLAIFFLKRAKFKSISAKDCKNSALHRTEYLKSFCKKGL